MKQILYVARGTGYLASNRFWGRQGGILLAALFLFGSWLGVGHGTAAEEVGQVIAWGANSAGQTNVPPGLTEVVAITAGSEHALALRADGRIVGWGNNNYHQIDIPPSASNVVSTF